MAQKTAKSNRFS